MKLEERSLCERDRCMGSKHYSDFDLTIQAEAIYLRVFVQTGSKATERRRISDWEQKLLAQLLRLALMLAT